MNKPTAIEPIDAFRTSDGQIFTDERMAFDHQTALDLTEELNRFFDSPHTPYEPGGRTEAVMRKTIRDWEAFKRSTKGGEDLDSSSDVATDNND